VLGAIALETIACFISTVETCQAAPPGLP